MLTERTIKFLGNTITHTINVTMLSIFLIAQTAYGEQFECSFVQEKHSTGKSNRASCSMLPEVAFSLAGYTPRRNEHCEVDEVYLYEDLRDFVVNMDTKIVKWTRYFGFTEEAKQERKAECLKEGKSEDEANKESNFRAERPQFAQIVNYHKSNTSIFFDEITRKRTDPPKQIPEHSFILANPFSVFYLYIPEASGHAILVEPDGKEDCSWARIYFGKCRKIE